MLRNAIELPKTMAAVVCHAPEDYRLEELPVPEAGPGEVLVKVESVGICASDLKCYLGAPLFWGDASREGYCQPPITPGHEFVGEVVALGEGAGREVRARDRRPRGLRADRPLLELPLLPDRQVLDVRGPRHLRLPPAHPRRDGRLRPLPGRRAQPQGPGRDAGAPCRLRRAARLLDPRGPARQHRVPGHRRDRRRRPARPRHDRRRPHEAAGAADRRRPQRRPARDGQALRRRHRPQPDQGRRGRRGAGS